MLQRIDAVGVRTQTAKRLLAVRKAIGLNQREFARRAGIPANTYNQYEKKGFRPSLDYAMALCDTYGLTLDYIYRGDASGLPDRISSQLRPPKH